MLCWIPTAAWPQCRPEALRTLAAASPSLNVKRTRRPAAVDALDQDHVRVGIPSYVSDGDAAFKARYFFAELVRWASLAASPRPLEAAPCK